MYLANCQLDECREGVIITGPCVFTGKLYRVGPVKREDLNRWVRGALIQDVFPDLSTDDREFLISGISPEAWNRMIRDDGDDEQRVIRFKIRCF